MDACKACGGIFDRSEKCVLCSGLCGKVFHPGCVGLNVTNFKAWTANVGLLWFCESCRVNFNPIVMNREAVIMKTMRDLLLRVDSLDLRVGQFGENLKIMNSCLSMPTSGRRESNISSRLQQFLASGAAMDDSADFFNSIDRLNLDSSIISNAANNTIGDGNEVSILASVNDVNDVTTAITAPTTSFATTVAATSAAVAATSAAAAVAATSAAAAVAATSATTAAATTVPARTAAITFAATTDYVVNASSNVTGSPVASTSGLCNRSTLPNNPSADDNCRLKVVSKNRLRTRRESIDDLKSFYVTPFHNAQTEEDIVDYLREVINTDTSRITCVKLVPRNKNIDECTFVSFKLSVSKDLVSTVSDAFYWPEGVEIREFRPKNDKVLISTKPT